MKHLKFAALFGVFMLNFVALSVFAAEQPPVNPVAAQGEQVVAEQRGIVLCECVNRDKSQCAILRDANAGQGGQGAAGVPHSQSR